MRDGSPDRGDGGLVFDSLGDPDQVFIMKIQLRVKKDHLKDGFLGKSCEHLTH